MCWPVRIDHGMISSGMDTRFWLAVLLWYLLWSVATLLAFAIDKRRSARQKPRISESSLHLLELLGGWPGAILGQRLLRHKSRKWSYRIMLYFAAALHGIIWIIILYYWWSRR